MKIIFLCLPWQQVWSEKLIFVKRMQIGHQVIIGDALKGILKLFFLNLEVIFGHISTLGMEYFNFHRSNVAVNIHSPVSTSVYSSSNLLRSRYPT